MAVGTPTARRGLPTIGINETPDVKRDYNLLSSALDNAVFDKRGLAADRSSNFPSPKEGDRYWAYDTGELTRYTAASGGSWESVVSRDAAANVPSMRTLGTGPQQAAAGNDARLSDQRVPLSNSVDASKLADLAVGFAALGINAAVRYVAAKTLAAFSIGANTTVSLGSVNGQGNGLNRAQLIILLEWAENISGATSSASFTLYRGGSLIGSLAVSLPAGTSGCFNGVWNVGGTSGINTYEVRIQQANTPTNIRNYGLGTLLVLEM